MKGLEGKSCAGRAYLSGARSTLAPADLRSEQRPGSLGAHNLPRHNMGEKYKVCLWGTDSLYSWEHVKEFGDEFEIFSIVRAKTFKYKFDIRIINPFKRRPLSTLFGILNIARIMYLFLKYDRKCDCHLVHYLGLPYALAIALLPLRKPIVYCVYGSDARAPEGWNKKIVRKALGRIDVIFEPSQSFAREYIVSKYEVDQKKIVPILWYPVNSCFKKFDDSTIDSLRKKWNLTKEYIIFSPRITKELYNHDLLIDGVGLLNHELKRRIQVVLTGLGDPEYRKGLIEVGKAEGVEVVDLGRRITPEEMAEIYNISIITPNIAKATDDLGRSTFEAVACSSVLLLNKNSGTYQEIFRDGKYCKFVELTAEDIARSIEYVLDNRETLKDEEERSRLMRTVNWETNKRQISEYIKGLVER